MASLLGAVHLRMEPELVANERRVGVVSVTNFPEAPSLGKLAFLNRLPFELRSTVRLVPIAGAGVIRGGNGLAEGPAADPATRARYHANLASRGFTGAGGA